ncbi:hypothetical protein ACFE04_020573 [Oxalis oulophora]
MLALNSTLLALVEPEQEAGVSEPKRAAKIHDFCFGIPYGGIVLSGRLLSYIFSRNPASLVSGVLFGGALFGLSIFSLKVWRQGNSSLPFILGQAVLAAVLLPKNFQTYSLTKAVFPAGVNVFISAAMLCFYFYVMVSGGNPPPKKMNTRSSASSEELSDLLTDEGCISCWRQCFYQCCNAMLLLLCYGLGRKPTTEEDEVVLAAVLLQKNFQTYSLTKAVFPAGVNVFISAAMLCFYFYVMVSGGNPPPKKMKLVSEVS